MELRSSAKSSSRDLYLLNEPSHLLQKNSCVCACYVCVLYVHSACVYGSQRTLSVLPSLSTLLFQERVSLSLGPGAHALDYAGQQGHQDVPFPAGSLAHVTVLCIVCGLLCIVCGGCRGPDSRSHACTASACPTQFSPQPEGKQYSKYICMCAR